MKKLNVLFCLPGVIILFGGPCSTEPSLSTRNDLHGKINISGAFAIYPLMMRWAGEFQRIHPSVNFDIASGGNKIHTYSMNSGSSAMDIHPIPSINPPAEKFFRFIHP